MLDRQRGGKKPGKKEQIVQERVRREFSTDGLKKENRGQDQTEEMEIRAGNWNFKTGLKHTRNVAGGIWERRGDAIKMVFKQRDAALK